MQTQTRIDVFEEIFIVFLALGTLVGVVVVAYTLYNAYKYRDHDDRSVEADLPTLGELPTGGKGGKKLFVSFLLSAIIVVSLVVWTYGMLLYVEDGPPDNPDGNALEVDVEGVYPSWNFEYENGITTSNELVVPVDEPVELEVTAADGDVWHTFGVSDMRVKADAIPGETAETWFIADDTGDYEIECFELCGPAHTEMDGTLTVLSEEDYAEWEEEELADMEEDDDEDDGEGDD